MLVKPWSLSHPALGCCSRSLTVPVVDVWLALGAWGHSVRSRPMSAFIGRTAFIGLPPPRQVRQMLFVYMFHLHDHQHLLQTLSKAFAFCWKRSFFVRGCELAPSCHCLCWQRCLSVTYFRCRHLRLIQKLSSLRYVMTSRDSHRLASCWYLLVAPLPSRYSDQIVSPYTAETRW